jgi:uncharacterized protein with NAD-binding domain and iron-sulfur cluster
MTQKKIAVLGGGIGSLTTVMKLTDDPNWASEYEITVYQMGWRLGGKGASGRNPDAAQRIEEHGLHLWFGFYDNAFNLIQECYKANNRPPGAPLSTWRDAFSGYDTICLEEQTDAGWLNWPIVVPSNNQVPGKGGKIPTPIEYIYRIIKTLIHFHQQYNPEKSEAVNQRIKTFAQSPKMQEVVNLVSPVIPDDVVTFSDAGEYMLYGALKVSQNLSADPQLDLLNSILQKLKEWLLDISENLLLTDTSLRRFFIIMDFGYCTITGMAEDGVFSKGFDVINNIDFRDWLTKHKACEITVNSAVVQAVYGLVFGGKNQYTFEAGTALRGLLRMGLTAKGHVYYRMMAGMGDAIFAPIYEVLQKRGVQFEFFNKVTNIALSEDNQSVAAIEIDVQATLTDGIDAYSPLITVNDLPCWPNCPNYQYLQQGAQLQEQNINLESYYSGWQPVATKTLTTADFDLVILGISIGALPAIAPQLIANSTAWQNMVKNVIPVSTIAFQLWLNTSIGKMGWSPPANELTLLGAYQEPYDTWADMSDLIGREAWPEGYTPKNIAYFCGPTPAPYANEILKNAQQANFTDKGFPDKQTTVAKDFAWDYLQQLTNHIWPGISPGPGQFDCGALVDLAVGSGPERFDAQFFRANIDPTELYVMSFTGSSAFRLKTNESGYTNLYITGDWIDNGFNAGCIEATVMAGLQTARAVSGIQFDIPGENDIAGD